MNRLKLQHGISRTKRAKLQSSIDQTIFDDIELMAEWSNNEIQYVVNELLRFAIAQEEDFLKYKASVVTTAVQPTPRTKPAPALVKTTADLTSKHDAAASGSPTHL